MNWISFGNGIVAAGVLCALAAICVFALRALGRKSALFLAVFAAVSVVATLTAQKTFAVDAAGVCRTEKYGHWISRSPFCRVILDGEVMQRRHPLW
jgi:asparagine N-glycosylation enzyme membrane subunit Stt3